MRNYTLFQTRFLLVLSLVAVSACSAIGGGNEDVLKASGVVEVTQVKLASELGGQVLAVLVQEGDSVEAGQELVQFDGQLLAVQFSQAQASLAVAQASYDQLAATSELEILAAQQAIEDLYKHADVSLAEAGQEVANAQDLVRDAERRVTNLVVGSRRTDVDTARANVVLLEDQLEDALEDYEDYADKPETNLTRARYQLALSTIQRQYDDAVRLLNNLEGDANSIDMALAEADLAFARALLALAEINLVELQESGGPDPDALEMATASLAAAEAALPLALAQVAAAQAAVDLLAVQQDKLVITAPSDAVVLDRLAEPGEIVLPGAALLTIASLDEINITVYIPEERYGLINLGDTAQVTADSFPDESFAATVTRIADQAEYTPRNVQTEEDRRTTVFAIELTVVDPSGKLKPGMPGDVTFGE